MILDERLERFSPLSVRLELDPHLPWIECKGRVVWSVPSREMGSKRERCDTGIEFVDLDAGHQDLIRRYIEARVEAEGKRG